MTAITARHCISYSLLHLVLIRARVEFLQSGKIREGFR